MKGLKYYNDLNLHLIKELEAEIKRTEQEEQGIKSLKEAQLNRILQAFSMTTYSMV